VPRPSVTKFIAYWLFLAALIIDTRMLAQIGQPPPWWQWLEASQQYTVPFDINQDGVADFDFGFYQEFRGFVECCHADVDVYWEVIAKGDSKVLSASDVDLSPVVRLSAGETIGKGNSPGKIWSSGRHRLGTVLRSYGGIGPGIAVSGSGPFSERDGFLGVQFETLDGPALGWISMPKLLEGLSESLVNTNALRISGYHLAAAQSLMAGEVGDSRQLGIQRLLPADVDRDGKVDFIVEQIWSSPVQELGELLQVSIRGFKGARLLEAESPEREFPESSYLQREEFTTNGVMTGAGTNAVRLAKIGDRELLVPQNRRGVHWAGTEKWAVLWQRDLLSWAELGPLADGGTLMLGGKLVGQKPGWLRLSSPGGPVEFGGFVGYDCVAGRETNQTEQVVKRADLNDDGLVDVTLYGPAVPVFSQCGYRAGIEVLEPNLIPLTGWPIPGGQMGTNVLSNVLIPADRDLYQREPFLGPPPPVGSVAIDATDCYVCPRCSFPEVINQFVLADNFIPVRIQKSELWHAGWIGYASGRLEFVVNPTAGESIAAGKVLNPSQSIQITMEEIDGHVLIHWDSYIAAPVLEQLHVGESKWTKVINYDAWSLGVKLPVVKADKGAFFRLVY
jgi:hypothetical protein